MCNQLKTNSLIMNSKTTFGYDIYCPLPLQKIAFCGLNALNSAKIKNMHKLLHTSISLENTVVLLQIY